MRASSQLNNKLTGTIYEQPEQPEPQPPTWATYIGIPLAQNILGGVAVAGAMGLLWLNLARLFDLRVEYEDLYFWCGSVGGLVACVATFIRYFGDDFGLITAAYEAGRRSADVQISAMQAELTQLRVLAKEMKGEAFTQRGRDMIDKIAKAKEDADHLLGLAYGGHSIAREKVSAYMPQRSWERALQLLKSAGAIDATGNLTDKNLTQAHKRVQVYAEQETTRAQGGTWAPKWYVESK